MDTKYFRERFNLTQKEFSVLFDVPYATVRNWDARNSMPFYVWNLIDAVLRHRLQSFTYELRLMPDKLDLTKQEIEEEFKAILKDEAQTYIRIDNELKISNR